MFSFRRRPKTADGTGQKLKTSPSLPELHSQGIPWPENLVDVDAIRQSHSPPQQPSGAVKNSLQHERGGAIPFHKPFRSQTSGSINASSDAPISTLYMSHGHPPSAFDQWRSSTATTGTAASSRRSHRKHRAPPSFNVMVVGGRGTGKTSLLRLLLETADISPSATPDQRTAVQTFLGAGLRRTDGIKTACVEICESRYERVLLTVIDTPGLDFAEGRELRVERQVTAVIKYLDAQYADTMNEESKVVRQSKGDQHVHLCIFLIDPSSIMTPASRRAQSFLPAKTRSETTINATNATTTTEPLPEDDDPPAGAGLTMSPAEIRVIRRLSARVNVLPVIARADSLTDETLASVKDAVRRGLEDAGLDFGVFLGHKPDSRAPSQNLAPEESESPVQGGERIINGNGNANGSPTAPAEPTAPSTPNGHGNGVIINGSPNGNGVNYNANGIHPSPETHTTPERPSRPVIKLRGLRLTRSRSRSRRDLSSVVQDEGEPYYPDATDEESVANVRFSASVVSRTDLATLLPFALIAPESSPFPRRAASPDSRYSVGDATGTSTPAPESPATRRSAAASASAFLQGPPDDLRGVFTRRFRWGTVDVLNPEHCDFAALRTAVLLTHIRTLKVHTREVLYEKYRTEKLLARRATRNIGPEETKRLLEDLGL
ncbi:Septin-domain-containing protein [Hygrophoropsis aurantiaca]|uniref:Septin-domain-containing protein n=1 Tax=Hygrophoropsis aurantiaca TaxID=72124 RepID=A0ACB7ZYR1_9AGAM|nr:Septin-domain-containing protein [Hygrophoropsis aurantiaca]